MSEFGLHNGFRVTHACRASCQNAKASPCRCICGGLLHGITRKDLSDRQEAALKKEAQEFIQDLAHDFNGNPDKEGFYRPIEIWKMDQLSMFEKEEADE